MDQIVQEVRYQSALKMADIVQSSALQMTSDLRALPESLLSSEPGVGFEDSCVVPKTPKFMR